MKTACPGDMNFALGYRTMSNILRRFKGSADKNYCLFLKMSGRTEKHYRKRHKKHFVERLVERSARKSNPKFLKPVTKGRSPALA